LGVVLFLHLLFALLLIILGVMGLRNEGFNGMVVGFNGMVLGFCKSKQT
jgi:hypothetical protein